MQEYFTESKTRNLKLKIKYEQKKRESMLKQKAAHVVGTRLIGTR